MIRVVSALILILAAGSILPSTVAAQGADPAPQNTSGDPIAELEAKKAAIDLSDAEQLFEVAAWATKNLNDKVRAEGRKMMKEVLELDSSHEGAHTFFKHVKVGDTWYDSKEKAAKAQKEVAEKEMKAKGFLPHQGGWIKPEDKAKFGNGKGWVKDENGCWMSEEDVHRARGEVTYQGEWLRVGPEDLKRMEKHKKITGEDMLICTTEHFVLHLAVPPKFMKMYAAKAEDIYNWFFAELHLPAEAAATLWPRKAHIWSVPGEQQFQDWLTAYTEEYAITDEDKKHFRERPNTNILGGKLLAVIINRTKKAEDIDGQLCHIIAHFLLGWQTQGKASPWFNEGFANLVESLKTAEKVGTVSCSNRSRYGGQGDIADKDFNTKDAPPRCKSLVKADEDLPVDELAKLELNALDGNSLSKGFSIIEWLYNKDRSKLTELINAIRATGGPEQGPDAEVAFFAKCIAAVFGGSDLLAFNQMWRDYVKKNYK
jgi:hypothetical protein